MDRKSDSESEVEEYMRVCVNHAHILDSSQMQLFHVCSKLVRFYFRQTATVVQLEISQQIFRSSFPFERNSIIW